MSEERTGKLLQQMEHIRRHLFHRYSIAVGRKTFEVMTST